MSSAASDPSPDQGAQARTPPRPIGLEAYTQLARDRIADYFRKPQDEALVIGVFGEWGSGKSTLLDDIARAYTNTPDPANQASEVVLRVKFNAWRYEREEHLLIPLLFTVETTLNEYLAKIDRRTSEASASPSRWRWLPWSNASGSEPAANAPPRETTAAWLRARAVLLGRCVVALTRAVKLTIPTPLGEAEIDPYAAVEAFQAQSDRAAERAGLREPLRPAWRSTYYDLHRELQKVTRGNRDDPQKLNFVFFIDDLDRCLPEKAVEMLEAIKLFLDIEGCVFVLAVDDEVVERGIAHRYRDYLGIGDRSADSVAYSLKPERFREYRSQFAAVGHVGSAPITGHEYLEKIIQLPIRLPRFSLAQARQLLLDTAARLQTPQMFSASAPHPGREESEWLLDLFLAAAPLSPRKLIRATELLHFVRALAERLQRFESLHQYTLAQLVLLQCFAPHMFRDLARRRAAAWKRFAERIDEADLAGVSIGTPSFLTWWDERIADDKKQKSLPGTVKRAEVIEEPFLAQLRQTIGFRSGFDPRDLFLVGHGYTVDDDLAPYFNLLVEKPVVVNLPAEPPAAGMPQATVGLSGLVPSPVIEPVSAPPPAESVAAPAPVAAPAAAQPPVAAPTLQAAPAPAAAPRESRQGSAKSLTAAPRQPTTFVDLLFAPDAATRISAIRDEPALAGRVLNRRTVSLILARLKNASNAVTASWLSTIGNYLSDEDLSEVLRASGVVGRLASSSTFADRDELGRILEWCCLRMRPWSLDNRDTLPLEHLGATATDVDPYHKDWSYRYLRGIREETVTSQEQLDIWPGFAATTDSDIRTIVEISPGRVACASAKGEVGIWSRFLRGAWQLDEKFMSCGSDTAQIAPLDTLHIASHVSSQGVTIWDRLRNGWFPIFWDTDVKRASLLTTLARDAFAMCVTETQLAVCIQENDAGQASRWVSSSGFYAAQPVRALVGIGPREVLVVGGMASIVAIDRGVLSTKITVPTSDSFVHGSQCGDLILLTTTTGQCQTWRRDGDLLTQSPHLPSELNVAATLTNGTRALLVDTAGHCELWDCENANAPQLVGSGSIGTAAHPGVCLLCDGSVLVATPSGVQLFSVDHWHKKLEFSEVAIALEPAPTVLVAASDEQFSVVRGEWTASIADGPLASCSAVPSRVTGAKAGAIVAPGVVAIIGKSNTVTFQDRDSRSVVPIEDEPQWLGAFADGLVVGMPRRLAFLNRRDGQWVVARTDFVNVTNFGNTTPSGLATDGRETGLLWSATGMVEVIRWNGNYGPSENRTFTIFVPHGGGSLRSVVPVPSDRLPGMGNGSRFLGCLDRSIVLLSVDESGVQSSGQYQLSLFSFTDIGLYAIPVIDDQVLVLTGAGHVSSLALRPQGVATGAFGSRLHGTPTHVLLRGARPGAVVRTADDGVYVLTIDPNNVLSVRRYVVQSPVLVEGELEYGDVRRLRLSAVSTGQREPDLFKQTSEGLRIDPAVVRLTAWMRSNGRLAELFERPTEYSVTPVDPFETPERRYLEIRASSSEAEPAGT
jgi:hypothetical protein